MAVKIVLRGFDGKTKEVNLDDDRLKVLPKRAPLEFEDAAKVFAGNAVFVELDPNKYFKHKR